MPKRYNLKTQEQRRTIDGGRSTRRVPLIVRAARAYGVELRRDEEEARSTSPRTLQFSALAVGCCDRQPAGRDHAVLGSVSRPADRDVPESLAADDGVCCRVRNSSDRFL